MKETSPEKEIFERSHKQCVTCPRAQEYRDNFMKRAPDFYPTFKALVVYDIKSQNGIPFCTMAVFRNNEGKIELFKIAVSGNMCLFSPVDPSDEKFDDFRKSLEDNLTEENFLKL